MILANQRDLFEIPESVAYLNCAYVAPLMRSARAAGESGLASKSRPWEIRPLDFFDGAEVARGLFARLIGGDADGVALIPSVSYGMAIAAANLPLKAGQEILVLAEQFPSNVYPWRDLAERVGARIVTVARPADDDWTAAVLAALTPDTAILALPHCHWTDGGLLDLVTIGIRARAQSAALVVDATQSLGAWPLDVSAVQPDFLVVAAYKWLFGPYSQGFLYAAPQHREGRPIEHSWFNRVGSEDFTRLIDYQDAFQPGARRYDVGQRTNLATLPVTIAALEQLLAWGVPDIAETLTGLTATVEAGARALGLGAVAADLRGGHMIGLRFPEGLPADLPARLIAAQVYVSVRGDSLRVAPHLYNTPADLARLLTVLETVDVRAL